MRNGKCSSQTHNCRSQAPTIVLLMLHTLSRREKGMGVGVNATNSVQTQASLHVHVYQGRLFSKSFPLLGLTPSLSTAATIFLPKGRPLSMLRTQDSTESSERKLIPT